MHQSSSNYGEKEILGDALTAEKTATTLYNTFSNECVHPEVRQVLIDLLNEEHDIQFDVFNAMHERGFYPTPAAEDQKVQQMKQTYSQDAQC